MTNLQSSENIPARESDDVESLKARIAELEYENQKTIQLLDVGLELASQVELADLFPLVISKVTEVMEADRTSLFLYDKKVQQIWTMVAEGLDTNEIRLPVNKGIIGYVCRTGEMLNIHDAYDCDLFDPSFDKKTGYRTKSVLCLPLKNRQGEILGALQVLNKRSADIFSKKDEQFLQHLSGQIAVYVENAELYQQIEDLFDSVVKAIALAIDERDPVTAGHSRRVAKYTLNIAKRMHTTNEGCFSSASFSRAELKELRYACLLHDFGKVGVPESVLQKAERLPQNWINVISERTMRTEFERFIANSEVNCEDIDVITRKLNEKIEFLTKLNSSGFLSDEAEEELNRLKNDNIINDEEFSYLSIKRGTLTSSERDIMEGHVQKTYSVLTAIPWPEDMKNVPSIAGNHHEALNGTGYPAKIKGDEIPFGAKIMAVADVYDALTAQDRPYKPAIPHEKSAAILRSMAEQGKLDSEIVELFLVNELYEIDE